MDKICIEGGYSLKGEVYISGAKNAALPILVSSLLTEGWNTYYNVPRLRDISTITKLLTHLGVEVEREGDIIKADASGLNNYEAPYDLVRTMRASILVLGPLIARLKKARVSLPGGCAIGARPVNLHIKGLQQLGADIVLNHGYIEARADRLKGNEIYFDIVTVTGTENLMMAAVLADGVTILRNAAMEPEVVALADVLKRMGAIIDGAGSSVIRIKGVKSLHPTTFTIIPDRIEAGTFMIAAGLTRGDVRIKGCEPNHLQALIHKLRQTGITVEKIRDDGLHVIGPEKLMSVDIETLPYPGFPTDMQAQFMVLMCQASGLSVIISELQRMGADIIVSGNTAVVKGGGRLSAAPVMATDLRASASLILAGLIAEGVTEVSRVYHIDRGYENIEGKLSNLGAHIWRTRE